MKRQYFVALLTATLVVLMVACSSSNTNTAASKTADTDQAVADAV